MTRERYDLRACAGLFGGLLAALYASNVQAQSQNDVEVVVSAEVPAQCGFTASTLTIDAAADLEQAQTETVRLGIGCNAPYAITARATNGRLMHQGAGDDGSGFAFSKSYGVTLRLDTDQGEVLSERCLSDTMTSATAGCALSTLEGLASGEGVSIGRDAVLTIDWPDQNTVGQRLAAGAYSDTIILEIGART